MISAIELLQFKCFRACRIPMAPLTLLAGINGTGKSTVMQSLLLLRQSYRDNFLGQRKLALNGPMVTLGTARDVLYEFADNDEIGITVEHGGSKTAWVFDASGPQNDVLPVSDGPDTVPELSLFQSNVFHLSAERVGPRITYPLIGVHAGSSDQMHSDGRLAAAWFHENQDRKVEEQVRHPKAASNALREQVEAWLGEVSPGVRFSVAAHTDLQLAELSFGYAEGQASTRQYRPTGVGFGLSYTFPIVVAALVAKPGVMLLIENPEAHLHPRGQMAMGELLARASAAGAQVVIETHSDHVLNGIRLAVKRGHLPSQSVAVHFFTRRAEDGIMLHEPHSPTMDEDGRLDEWPEGFFDQFDIALEELL